MGIIGRNQAWHVDEKLPRRHLTRKLVYIHQTSFDPPASRNVIVLYRY
jgi:hypothetical protein